MAKKRKNDDIESDTDPIGMKPKRKGKPKKNEQQLADLILEGWSATVHTDPPKKKRRWLKWGLIGFGMLWVMSLFAPPKDKATPPAQVEQVVIRPTNTVQPTITPVSRATLTAQALIALDTAKTQTAPTQTPIIEYVVVTATSSATDIPTETAIPSDVPLPSATPMALATPTATLVIRDVTEEGLVTGMRVNVRTCTNVQCEILGQAFSGELYPIFAVIENGQNVQGNTVWYRIDYKGTTGYISDELMDIVYPVSLPVQQPMSTIQPTQPIVAPVSNWSCSGDLYNCPDFGAGGQFTCQQLFEYMSACPNDPSRLDREHDGRFCENRCG